MVVVSLVLVGSTLLPGGLDFCLALVLGFLHWVAQGLLADCILASYLHELAHGLNVRSGQLVLQELVLDSLSEGLDGLGLRDVLGGVVVPSLSLDVILDLLPILLDTKPENLRDPRPPVRAMEVLDECLLEILLVIDAILGQAVDPRPR